MIENKEVTAKWARETSQAVLGEKVRGQVEQCLTLIQKAVASNHMSVGISLYVDNLTIKELEKRGFIVKQQDDQRDGPYLTISW